MQRADLQKQRYIYPNGPLPPGFIIRYFAFRTLQNGKRSRFLQVLFKLLGQESDVGNIMSSSLHFLRPLPMKLFFAIHLLFLSFNHYKDSTYRLQRFSKHNRCFNDFHAVYNWLGGRVNNLRFFSNEAIEPVRFSYGLNIQLQHISSKIRFQ